MDLPVTDAEFTRTELTALLVSAVVVAVMFGPRAITIEGVDALWVTALSVTVMAALAFLTALLTLIAIKRF